MQKLAHFWGVAFQLTEQQKSGRIEKVRRIQRSFEKAFNKKMLETGGNLKIIGGGGAKVNKS